MGADVTMANDFIEVRGTGTLNGVDLDMSQISDTAQTVAAIAPFADGPTRITGIGFIRKKETDRVAAVVNELQRMGIDAVEEADGFLINPGTPQPATIETYTITAMAMSFAITGLMTPGITIADPACLRCGSCSAAPTKQEPLRQAIDDESWPPRYPYAGRVTERRSPETSARFWQLSFDPATEVLVTAGATEALAASLLAFVRPGDEVVMFEPYYDSYAAGVALTGGTRKVVTLRPPQEGQTGFQFDLDELRGAITPKTKVLLLNTPHNPTGKVFSRTELMQIAEVALDHDLLVISDEVYEHLTFDGAAHIPIATLPGMADRTITISSGGKSFSFTGWKVGWACARPHLINAIRSVKQFLTFVNAAPFQSAIAVGLRLGDDYFQAFAAELQGKRDRLNAGLEAAGFTVYSPQGTYFSTVDIRPLGYDDGRSFCLALPELVGVVAIPSQVFYTNKAEGKHLVRFAFCKQDAMLDAAVERLANLNP
ncbi:putative N-succinyldiaminopimelate aminotransferase DapC [Nymphon striatum]|nr:putative N-succinyldiaminopimelate aminotransferase DapC [Nymphon striatum]